MRTTTVFFSLFAAAIMSCTAAEELQGPGALPIEINATGPTTYENGIATARDPANPEAGSRW